MRNILSSNLGLAFDSPESVVPTGLTCPPRGAAADHDTAGARRDVVEFVVTVGQGLHRYGAAADRLETVLATVSTTLGVPGRFFVTPTGLIASFPTIPEQPASILRTEPGTIDLGKLAAIEAVMSEVCAGRLAAGDGRLAIEQVVDAPNRYGTLVSTVAFGVASAGAARFFAGGLAEIGVAGVIGVLIGVLGIVVARCQRLLPLFEFVAAAVASFVATIACGLGGGMSPHVATLSGLIVLLPGLGLTVAMTELATRHLVSGTARLTGALMGFFAIGIGVAIGVKAGTGVIGPVVPVEPTPLPAWTLLAAMIIAPIAFTVLFHARVRDGLLILPTCWLAFGASRLATDAFGPELGVLLGAGAVGLAANLQARRLDRPPAVLLLPGIILLVPGSLGFKSFEALMADDVIAGIETAFTMVLVSIALAVGLLLANVILPPKRGG